MGGWKEGRKKGGGIHVGGREKEREDEEQEMGRGWIKGDYKGDGY